MKKYIFITIAACVLLGACEEFTPVFTSKYENPPLYEDVEGSQVVPPEYAETVDVTPIAELTKLYQNGKPLEIEDDIIISGRIVSSDRYGNFYNSFYIQDETGGIEVKVAKNSLYNEYKLGQKVYVICGPTRHTTGLWLGSYGYKSGNYGGNGMTQLGAKFFDNGGTTYETAYIRADRVIREHVLREDPEYAQPVEPAVLAESMLPKKDATHASCKYLGQLVTLKGLKYADKVFSLLYLNSDESNKNSENRVFLSDKTWGIDSWAMSKGNFLTRLQRGDWDEALIGNSGQQNYGSVGEVKREHVEGKDPAYLENVEKWDEKFCRNAYWWIYGVYPEDEEESVREAQFTKENLINKWPRYCLARNANGYSVSQYFTMGGTEIALRTSGFSRFADRLIPEEVLNGSRTVSITGILTLYQGSIQLVVNSAEDIVVE